MPDLEESPSSQLCWEETPEEKPDPPERTERRSVEGRRVMFQSKTVDLRHSLLHQIAELETQSRAPLNRKLRTCRSTTGWFHTSAGQEFKYSILTFRRPKRVQSL